MISETPTMAIEHVFIVNNTSVIQASWATFCIWVHSQVAVVSPPCSGVGRQ